MDIEMYQYPLMFLSTTANALEMNACRQRSQEERDKENRKAYLLRTCFYMRTLTKRSDDTNTLVAALEQISIYKRDEQEVNDIGDFKKELQILFMIWQNRNKKKIQGHFIEEFLIKDLSNMVLDYVE